jgi:hypothetical protein
MSHTKRPNHLKHDLLVSASSMDCIHVPHIGQLHSAYIKVVHWEYVLSKWSNQLSCSSLIEVSFALDKARRNYLQLGGRLSE